MPKVYVLFYDDDYREQYGEIVGIFSTREKAVDTIDSCKKWDLDTELSNKTYHVREYDLK